MGTRDVNGYVDRVRRRRAVARRAKYALIVGAIMAAVLLLLLAIRYADEHHFAAALHSWTFDEGSRTGAADTASSVFRE